LDLGARAVWNVVIRSPNAVIYDIKEDKRGMLFQRLIEHGSPNPDALKMQFSDNGTILPGSGLGRMYLTL